MAILSDVEGFLDRMKLRYKWRYGRWGHLQLVAYRGYGTSSQIYLKGRVLDDKHAAMDGSHETWWENVANTIRRLETDEIPGATVRVRYRGTSIDVTTGEDGFFDVTINIQEAPSASPWMDVPMELLAPESRDGRPVETTAQVLVPLPDAEFGVISDLDDTVIRTGAANRLRFIRTMLLNNAHSHVPFEGVAEFYRGLELGPDEKGHNPIFYVSSSPWNFYDLFDSFMDFHGLPRGPIFLKNFGFKEGKALRADHSSYKMEIIQSLLDLYPNLPFILAGDSGQMDPEIYRDVATVHGSRIRAIYLRDVSSPKRDRVVHGIAGEIEARGIPVLLAERTLEAGDHALEHGFISHAALEEIRTAHSEAAAAG